MADKRRDAAVVLKQAPFWSGDRDVTIKCRDVRLVVTKSPHFCSSCNHFKGKVHPAGTRMVRDHALVDGSFGTSYTCLPCIEAWADECEPRRVKGE